MTHLTFNEELNGIELKFDEKPNADVLIGLKCHGFRWHHKKKLWYAKQSYERTQFATELADEPVTFLCKSSVKEEPTNQFGVKVGDLFVSSWGYEQTNVDFFQVVKLCGKKSVRVREVCPQLVTESATGPMSADRTYVNTTRLLPPAAYSVHIKDQENGDLKRLKSWSADGKSNPVFDISSYASAHKVEGDTITCYESWYY